MMLNASMGRPSMKAFMTSLAQIQKRCRLWLALSLLASGMLLADHACAQEEKTIFVEGNRSYEVTIRRDVLGVLLAEKALQRGPEAATAFDSLGLKLPEQVDDGPVIVQLNS